MLNMRYLGSGGTYQVNFKRISDHVVQVTGDFPIQTAGFYLSRISANDSWDYSAFKTVYKEVDEGAQFSDDGTVYPESENEEKTPTLRDEVNDLKESVSELQGELGAINTAMGG